MPTPTAMNWDPTALESQVGFQERNPIFEFVYPLPERSYAFVIAPCTKIENPSVRSSGSSDSSLIGIG